MVDKNLFKKSFPFICIKCNKLTHTIREYCESCGSLNTVKKAEKINYKEHFNKNKK